MSVSIAGPPRWRRHSNLYLLDSEVPYFEYIAASSQPVSQLRDTIRDLQPGYFARRWVYELDSFIALLLAATTGIILRSVAVFVTTLLALFTASLILDAWMKAIDLWAETLACLIGIVRLIGSDDQLPASSWAALATQIDTVAELFYRSHRATLKERRYGRRGEAFFRSRDRQLRASADALRSMSEACADPNTNLQALRADLVRAILRLEAGTWHQVADLAYSASVYPRKGNWRNLIVVATDSNQFKTVNALVSLIVIIAAIVRAVLAVNVQ